MMVAVVGHLELSRVLAVPLDRKAHALLAFRKGHFPCPAARRLHDLPPAIDDRRDALLALCLAFDRVAGGSVDMRLPCLRGGDPAGDLRFGGGTAGGALLMVD